jgi:hypothetical protein
MGRTAALLILLAGGGCLDTASLAHRFHGPHGDGSDGGTGGGGGVASDMTSGSGSGEGNGNGGGGGDMGSSSVDLASGGTCAACSSSSYCSAGACVPCPTGTADCDGNPGNGCEARLDQPPNCGACNAGTVISCYPDSDGDKYGALGSTPASFCGPTCPAGHAPVSGDCDDSNGTINPGQTEPVFYFPPNAKTFDANCDGHITISYCSASDHSYCATLNNGQVDCLSHSASDCNKGNGWMATPPTCGQTATYVSCISENVFNTCGTGSGDSWSAGCL